MERIIWLLPVLFIFHDFEEILFMRVWIEKNRAQLLQKYPVVAKRMLASSGDLTTEGFAFAVFIIFLILCAISAIVCITGLYLLWMAVFMVYYLHLFMHIGQAMILRSYVPALVTSMIAIVPCTIIFYHVYELFTVNEIILSWLVAVIGVGGLFIPLIKLARRFDQWLVKYKSL